ncbi:MAG: N-acetyltransferase [Oscillatoria sp. PMC 1051.18]|nr:N-acetyltransferase [Oscillatoria sp. PMC 1050.18]MEC5031116.1 N-acetyltransferase [Oscillatoria sp. PMC 1051.18]
MEIRQSTQIDIPTITQIHFQAFGEAEGREIAELVTKLFDDRTAAPLLSLVAEEKGELFGHILFSKTTIVATGVQTTVESVSSRILAPLAVIPRLQKRGIGKKLIHEGLKQLRESGVELVFVLGHPGYYPRFGFVPAGNLGFEAPYPIPEEHTNAWMVQGLLEGVIERIQGKVQCSRVLNQPQYWQE